MKIHDWLDVEELRTGRSARGFSSQGGVLVRVWNGPRSQSFECVMAGRDLQLFAAEVARLAALHQPN